MNNLRKRAQSLYPHLNNIESKHVKKAKQRLDSALTNARGILDTNHPAARELSQACDFASTIISNS